MSTTSVIVKMCMLITVYLHVEYIWDYITLAESFLRIQEATIFINQCNNSLNKDLH